MYRRDYFSRLIEDFSKVLAKLAGLKLEGKFTQASELIRESYKEYLKFDYKTTENIGNIELEDFLIKQNISAEQTEVLANLLMEEADILNKANDFISEKDNLKKAYIVVNFLIKSQKHIFSLSLQHKLALISKKLNELK
jgi:hypothetical protein